MTLNALRYEAAAVLAVTARTVTLSFTGRRRDAQAYPRSLVDVWRWLPGSRTHAVDVMSRPAGFASNLHRRDAVWLATLALAAKVRDAHDGRTHTDATDGKLAA